MKVTKEMVTDYIRRPGIEELTVGELLEFLRSQPDGCVKTKQNGNIVKKLESLKNELDRIFTTPKHEKMPTHLKKQFESDVLTLFLNPNRIPLTVCYSHVKEAFQRYGYKVPALSTITRRLHSIPTQVISTARTYNNRQGGIR